jgi:hypothetical protein
MCLAGLLLGAMQARAAAPSPGYSSAGLYNLANSYARAGKPGMAVLNYERASLLAPNDPDIVSNLNQVRAAAHLPVDSPSGFERLARIAGPTLVFWIGVSGLAVLGAGLIAAQLSLHYRRLRLAAMLLGICMLALPICNAIALWPRLHEGVVIAAATPVRVSPVPMGESLFILPEGETVGIMAEHEGFTLIRTRAGRSGWVADANLAPILPRKKTG